MPLPIYHHPSLTVLIDDSDSFLRSLSFQLDPALASKSFHDTRSAIDWLDQQRSEAPCSGALHASYDTYPNAHEECNIAFDIDQIHRISFRRQRFMTPSVLVVDYCMPQMNGVQVCEALRHLPCKKILFTGVADEKVAVDAFNRGLIDRYIKRATTMRSTGWKRKSWPCSANILWRARNRLHDMLTLHNYAFVSDQAFAQLVRDLVREHKIVEHYVYSSPA
ncbi:response regulator [Massilia sp. B-10]|nr:response regulator [Massilia sp. B-10]